MNKNKLNLYSAKEVAEMLGVTRVTVYRWIKEGKLKSVKIGGSVRIWESELNEFIGFVYKTLSKML